MPVYGYSSSFSRFTFYSASSFCFFSSSHFFSTCLFISSSSFSIISSGAWTFLSSCPFSPSSPVYSVYVAISFWSNSYSDLSALNFKMLALVAPVLLFIFLEAASSWASAAPASWVLVTVILAASVLVPVWRGCFWPWRGWRSGGPS